MAGMLPGVEAARRRRIHNNNNNNNNYGSPSLRRPSFCLYATTNDSLPKSSTRELIPIREKGLYDESLDLGVAAREAKKRLDHRFQSQSTSQTNRKCKGVQGSGSMDNIAKMHSNSQSHVSKLTENKSKRVKWLKIGWKSCEQEECGVCLEEFKAETQMQLGVDINSIPNV